MKGKTITITTLMTATILAVLLAAGSALAGPSGEITAAPASTAGPGVKIFLPLVTKNLTMEVPPTRLALLRWIKHGEVRIDRGETYDRAGAYAPAIVTLPNGTYRMYYSGFDGINSRILSAISSDGQTWNKEAGVRINIWGPYVAVYSPEVIRLPNGTYRMYFSARSADPLYANIHSAFSADGLSWQIMSGIRIQHGGTFDTVLAQNPSLVQNPDGSPFLYPDGRYRMYYAGFDGSHFRILSASSQDGLSWQKEKIRLDCGGRYSANQMNDPEIVQLPDGSFRLFYAGSNGTATAQAHDADLQPSLQSSPTDVPLDGYVILSAWSADGLQWVQEKGARLTRGDAGRPDGASVYSPVVARIGDSYRLFYTANDGLVALIMDSRVLPDDAYILRNFHTRRVSIAQVEVTVDYNVSAFLPSMQPNLFITAAVLQQGAKLSSFGVPFDPISPTVGTAKFLIEYFGDKPKASDEIQVTLWAKIGELCPDPNAPPCYPVGFDAYSEQFDAGLSWLPGTGGTLKLLDIYEALPQQPAVPSGPYLNARILYSYYNVWGTGALVDLEFYDEHGKVVEDFDTTPVPIYPNKGTQSDGSGTGVVRVPVRYTGTNQKLTASLKATLRIGHLASPMAEATKPYQKTWKPPAAGVIRSIRREQPVPHKANFIVDYDYTPLPGIDLPAWVSASVLKGGSQVQTNFKSSPAPLVAGRGQVTVTVNYTGDQTGYTTDQVRLEMSIPNLILANSTQNWSITWNPPETGKLSVAPTRGAIREPIPDGAELEVDLQYTYRSRGATRATIRIQAIKKGATDGRLPVAEATISPAEDARQTLKLRYTAADRNLVSDQLRLTMVSQTTGETLDERVVDWAKTWNPPTTGRINAITVTQVTSWKARITVKYDYDSPADEPAWLSARWYVRYVLPQPLGYKDDPRLFFDQTKASLEEGHSKEATFFVFYSGSMYDLLTNLVKVYMYVGREQRSLTDNELGSVIWWSPPPVGSLGVGRVDSVDDRHIKVQANYSLLAGQCQNPTLRVEVWKNGLIGPLPDFQGNTPIQCTGSISNVLSVTATVAYTGDIPFLNTHLLMLKMLVNGVPVELEGGKDFRLEYEYEKEWNVTSVGEMAEPRVTWLSPRELALQVDYGYTSTTTLRPSIKLFRNGEDVTDRFEIDIFPGVIVVPAEGKAGSLAARIRYRDDYLEELVTDQIEVRLKNALGQTKVAGAFSEVLAWQHFETEEYRVAYQFQNLRIERPDDITIVAHMDFANPIRNDPHLILKPFLWRNNIPVLPVPPDSPNYADHSEFPFNYITATIGIGLFDTVEIVYTKPVGKFQFDAISFVLYEYAGNVPLYSRTFPFANSADGRITAPDDILSIELVTGLAADAQTGQIASSTNFIWNSGELWAMVTYAVNSDVAGMKIWPSEFYPGTATPYYPYELVGQQNIPVEKGLGLATFKFRLLDSYVDYDFPLDNTITWPGFRGDGTIEFNLGVPGQEPRVKKARAGFRDNYNQAADLRRPVGTAKPFPNQIELFNIDYVLPPTSGYEPPVYLGAVALKDGEPVQGLSMMPVIITDTGKGRVTSDVPIVLQFNSSDVATNTVSSDEVMLIMFAAEGEESAPFYRETFPYVRTWTRTADSVSVSSCESLPATTTEPPRIRVVTRYTYTDASAQRVAGYGGVTKLWAEGLQLSEPVGAYSSRLTLNQPGSGTAALTVELEAGIVARTTHVAVYMESFVQSNRGEIRWEGLAQAVVECRSLLVNENAFVVATLEEIEILDDGDTVTPVGEVMLATLGATSPEVTESNRWPIEVTNARWHEVHDTDESQRVLHPNFPFFTRRLYQMGPVLGLYVGAIEDDSMPSWVGTLISVVAKAGALVANCFGQAEIASALEMVGEFANQLLAKGALPDLIQVWGVHLPMSEQWGIQGDGEISYTEGEFKKGSGDKYPFIKPKIRMELIELPSDPKPVTVTLKKIVIHENGDNFNGEVFIHTRAFDGVNPSSELKFGTWSLSDGSTRNLNRVIYETEAIGPYLYVEVDVWDEDLPDVGDDNELLGVATWKFGPPYYGSNIHDSQCAGELAKRVKTPSGDVTVCIGIESP